VLIPSQISSPSGVPTCRNAVSIEGWRGESHSRGVIPTTVTRAYVAARRASGAIAAGSAVNRDCPV
jgi:hypothetical protein